MTKRITIPAPPFSPVVPRHLVSADDVDLAFTDGDRGLGRVDLRGAVSFSRPPFAGSEPDRLGVTSYGSLWYSDRGRQTLGNVWTPARPSGGWRGEPPSRRAASTR